MISANTLCKRLLNVKNCVIENQKIKADVGGQTISKLPPAPLISHVDIRSGHKRVPDAA